jgi:hypothetical protein
MEGRNENSYALYCPRTVANCYPYLCLGLVEVPMINVFRALLHWCKLVTAILVQFKGIAPQDRVDMRINLKELEESINTMEKERGFIK